MGQLVCLALRCALFLEFFVGREIPDLNRQSSDKFIEVFNNERPHEALNMKCPAEAYEASTRPYGGLPDIDDPFHDKTIVVTRCGRICLGCEKINFSQVFAGQAVGIKEVHDDI
jgi:putative transposase